MGGEFVLVAIDEFNAGKKLCLRWRATRRIIEALSNYDFNVEDLLEGDLNVIHKYRLEFYHDSLHYTESIMSHVSFSDFCMAMLPLL